MKSFAFLLLVFLTLVSEGQGFPSNITPPQAKEIPHRLEKHGDVRVDNYFWLKQRKSKDVLKYLKDENNYFVSMFKPMEPLKRSSLPRCVCGSRKMKAPIL